MNVRLPSSLLALLLVLNPLALVAMPYQLESLTVSVAGSSTPVAGHHIQKRVLAEMGAGHVESVSPADTAGDCVNDMVCVAHHNLVAILCFDAPELPGAEFAAAQSRVDRLPASSIEPETPPPKPV